MANVVVYRLVTELTDEELLNRFEQSVKDRMFPGKEDGMILTAHFWHLRNEILRRMEPLFRLENGNG